MITAIKFLNTNIFALIYYCFFMELLSEKELSFIHVLFLKNAYFFVTFLIVFLLYIF